MLRNDRAVLRCYSDAFDAHWHSALGATLAVLEAGYNIGSLMLRYKRRGLERHEQLGVQPQSKPFRRVGV